MNYEFGRSRGTRRVRGATLTLLYPLAAWLVGLAAFAWLATESLLPGEHLVFFMARITAYLTTALIGTTMLLFLALFGLGCGCALYWLEDGTETRPIVRAVVRAIGTSLWLIVAFMWLGVLLTAGWPPTPMSLDDPAGMETLAGNLENSMSFLWISRLRFAVLAGFLALCVWRLSRIEKTQDRDSKHAEAVNGAVNGNGATPMNAGNFTAKPWNAVLAVACGAALVAALTAVLGALASSTPTF